MELNVGMYVRTKDGEIAKILEIDNDTFSEPALRLDTFPLGMYQGFQKYIKASFNIIDLIEVGDYVNGYKILEVNNNLNEHIGTCNSLDTYLWYINENGEFKELVLFESDIKSIVTKEQFEKCIYKVGN